MTTMSWKNTVMWTALSLSFLLLAAMAGPAPALATDRRPGTVLYEVTEDMYLLDAAGNPVADPSKAARRSAVAQLAGWAALGTPLCPYEVLVVAPKTKQCAVNASGADNLSLADGRGTLGGTFAVVVQGDNPVDSPEFVAMTGTFKGDADLSPALSGQAPVGFITNGVGTVDGVGVAFAFTGTFRLPFSLTPQAKHDKPHRNRAAFYLGDDGKPFRVRSDELSLGFPTVRLEINFEAAK